MAALALINSLISKVDRRTIPKSLTITYFASHGKSGRGLSLRLCCILGEIQFEDIFVSRTEHYKQKESNQRRWSGVPEMAIWFTNTQSKRVAQSCSCLRYIGTITGFYPYNSLLKCALIDEVIDSVEDLVAFCLIPILKSSKEDTDAVINKLMNDNKDDYGTMRLLFDRFEDRLKENNEYRNNNNGYFVGDSMSIADIKFFSHFRNYVNGGFQTLFGIKKSVLMDNGYKRMDALLSKMENEPKIQRFIREYDDRIKKFGIDDIKEKYRTKIYEGKVVFCER